MKREREEKGREWKGSKGKGRKGSEREWKEDHLGLPVLGLGKSLCDFCVVCALEDLCQQQWFVHPTHPTKQNTAHNITAHTQKKKMYIPHLQTTPNKNQHNQLNVVLFANPMFSFLLFSFSFTKSRRQSVLNLEPYINKAITVKFNGGREGVDVQPTGRWKGEKGRERRKEREEGNEKQRKGKERRKERGGRKGRKGRRKEREGRKGKEGC